MRVLKAMVKYGAFELLYLHSIQKGVAVSHLLSEYSNIALNEGS